MLACFTTILLFGAGAIPVEQMREIVAARQAALDKLEVSFTIEMYTAPLEVEPLELDLSQWTMVLQPFEFRAQIARPGYAWQSLTDDPAGGWVQTRYAVTDGTLVRTGVDACRDGRRHYAVSPHHRRLGTADTWPYLKVLDLDTHESPRAGLNLRTIFEECDVAVVGEGDGYTTYAAALRGSDYDYLMQFDLNARGTPLRFRTELRFDNPALVPAVREQHVLQMASVGDYELPTLVLETTRNTNAVQHQGMYLMTISEWRKNDALDAHALAIAPETRNSVVMRIDENYGTTREEYDADGNLVALHSDSAPQGAHYAQGHGSGAIVAGAGAAVLGVALCVVSLVSWRRRVAR